MRIRSCGLLSEFSRARRGSFRSATVSAWHEPPSRIAESILFVPSYSRERVCRTAYRAYLRRRAASWDRPSRSELGDTILKLHTRSHRTDILNRYNHAVHDALERDQR